MIKSFIQGRHKIEVFDGHLIIPASEGFMQRLGIGFGMLATENGRHSNRMNVTGTQRVTG